MCETDCRDVAFASSLASSQNCVLSVGQLRGGFRGDACQKPVTFNPYLLTPSCIYAYLVQDTVKTGSETSRVDVWF
jgi:hypothetical protein